MCAPERWPTAYIRPMIAKPETAAWAGSPRWPCPDASSAAAPPTQKTSAKAAIASAAARRCRAGRSGKDGLERDADDLQPPREAVERELAQLVLADTEHRRGVTVSRECQRLRDMREQLAQHPAHVVGLLGLLADRLAQEPDAVADVTGLVVMDLRIALDETGQQTVLVEVVGDELEARQSERAFEHEVVERDEADLRGQVAGIDEQLLMRLDECDVEDLAEGVADALAGPRHMRTDLGRRRDDLVLEPRVELHVPRLVDLLGRQEGRLLLAVVGGDETGELRRDALLGDHQRCEHEVDERALLLVELRPLLPVGGEIDVERRPLRPLPATVERLRVVELQTVAHSHDLSTSIASSLIE